MNCSALTMIRLPYELTIIEANTFSGCTAMGGALYLPLDLETIGDSAFENCRAIGKVHVFGYVTRIGKKCFPGLRKPCGSSLCRNQKRMDSVHFLGRRQ